MLISNFLTWQQDCAKSPEDLESAQHDIPVPEWEEIPKVGEDKASGTDDAKTRKEPEKTEVYKE